MNSDVDGAAAAVENHDDAAFDHLRVNTRFSIVAALDRGTLGLKTQQEVGRGEFLDDARFEGSLAHELLLVLGPESGNSKHPADFVLGDLTNLLGQLFNGLVGNVAQGLGDDGHQVELTTVDGLGRLVHVQEVHLVGLEEQRGLFLVQHFGVHLEGVFAESEELALV